MFDVACRCSTGNVSRFSSLNVTSVLLIRTVSVYYEMNRNFHCLLLLFFNRLQIIPFMGLILERNNTLGL